MSDETDASKPAGLSRRGLLKGLGVRSVAAGRLSPVTLHDAQQCGFCTPGFVVACTAFVRNHPNATLDQVRAGLGGNLCRCGTYAGMMLAVVDAAKKGGS